MNHMPRTGRSFNSYSSQDTFTWGDSHSILKPIVWKGKLKSIVYGMRHDFLLLQDIVEAILMRNCPISEPSRPICISRPQFNWAEWWYSWAANAASESASPFKAMIFCITCWSKQPLQNMKRTNWALVDPWFYTNNINRQNLQRRPVLCYALWR